MRRTIMLSAIVTMIGFAFFLPVRAQEGEEDEDKPLQQKVTVVLRDGTRVEGVILGYGSRVYQVKVGENIKEIPEREVLLLLFDKERKRDKGAGKELVDKDFFPRSSASRTILFRIDRKGRIYESKLVKTGDEKIEEKLERDVFENEKEIDVDEPPIEDPVLKDEALLSLEKRREWMRVARVLADACESAPEDTKARERAVKPDPSCPPIRLVLRWNPTIERCKVYVGQVLCNYDEKGFDRARMKIRQFFQTGAKDIEIDAAGDVPVRWVLEAFRFSRTFEPRLVLFTSHRYLKELPGFSEPFRKVSRREERKDSLPDVAVRALVAPEAPFEAVAGIMMMCAGAGVTRIYLGTSPADMVEAFLPIDPEWLEKAKGMGAGDWHTSIGMGDSAPKGPFGVRDGSRVGSLRSYGGSRHTESAVLMGLIWLKNHQNPDGLWSCRRFMNNCNKGECRGAGSSDEYDMGVTGLAALAFLGAGHTHKHGKFKSTVKKALKAITDRQTPDGCLGSKTADGHWIYNHAICSLALAEAYGLSNKSPLLQGPAQKAVDFLVRCQNPYLGWRYGMRTGENDSSCTAWAVMALHSARISGLKVPETAFQGALNWFNKVTDEAYYKTGYTSKGDTGARLLEAVGKFQPTEAMTAAAVACRIFILGTKSTNRPEILGGGNLLKHTPPKWDVKGGAIDMYYWYWGTMAMFQLGRSYWKAWNGPLKNALVPTQKRSGCENGSWDPAGAWGMAGGRVYATAINVLSLEIYYRYAKVLPNRERTGRPVDKPEDPFFKSVLDAVMPHVRKGDHDQARKMINKLIGECEGYYPERVARLKDLLRDIDIFDRNWKRKEEAEREGWRRSVPLKQWVTLLGGREDFLSNWRATADVKLLQTDGVWTITIGGGGHSISSNFRNDGRWLDFELEFEIKSEVPVDLGYRIRPARRKFTGSVLKACAEWTRMRVRVHGVTAEYFMNGEPVAEGVVDPEPGGIYFRVRDAGKVQLRNLRIRVDKLGD